MPQPPPCANSGLVTWCWFHMSFPMQTSSMATSSNRQCRLLVPFKPHASYSCSELSTQSKESGASVLQRREENTTTTTTTMASRQISRKDNDTMERERRVEEQQQLVPSDDADARREREACELGARSDSVADKEGETRTTEREGGGGVAHVEVRAGGKGSGESRGEAEGVTAVITCKLEGRGKGEQEREDQNRQSSLDEISKYRAEAQQRANDAISAAQERYQRASGTAQAAQENSVRAEDAAMEKGQRGYDRARDYTVQAAEKAEPAGGAAAQYVGEKAVQAKDATAQTAADLKDKATVAGWGAAHLSAEKTVEGSKAAASAVQGAAGYAGQKASELAAKSANAVKGLAAAAGETVKEYTSRNKEEAEREFEAKKAAQCRETEGRTSAERGQGQDLEGRGKWRPGGGVGQTEAPREASKFHGVQERGTERNQGGVGETISPYVQKGKPTEGSRRQSGQVHGQDVTEGDVFAAHKPHHNIAGRSFQGEQAGFGQTRNGGDEAMETIDKNVGNPAQREQHYSSEKMAGFHGGREQLHERREDGVAAKSLGQVQGEQGRKGTEAMAITGGIVGNAAQREQKPMENTNVGKGSEAVTSIGETLGDVAHMVKKPLDNVTEGGGEMLGAVGETVVEIGENMIRPAQKVQRKSRQGKEGGGVLGAVGETVSEIAETTRVFVAGEGEAEFRQSIGPDSSSRRV